MFQFLKYIKDSSSHYNRKYYISAAIMKLNLYI